jgi:hypothetical protein
MMFLIRNDSSSSFDATKNLVSVIDTNLISYEFTRIRINGGRHAEEIRAIT